ncbi:MAG: 1,4-dihydroxy-2-naphthoate octaprenyltransferase [Chlamydiia bacterium]
MVIGTLLAPRPNGWLFALTLFCALLIQVATNYANDYYDCVQGKDTLNRKGPRRLGKSGLVPLPLLFIVTITIFALGFLLSCLLSLRGGPIISIMYLLASGAGIYYTKEPICYGYRGLAEPIVLFCMGTLATFFTYYLQTLTFSAYAFFIGLAPGFFSVALLGLNNLRDYEEDRVTEKKTLVVRLGKQFGKIEVTLALLLPFIIIPSPFNILIIPIIYSVINKLWAEEELSPLLGRIGLAYICYTLLYALNAFVLWG